MRWLSEGTVCPISFVKDVLVRQIPPPFFPLLVLAMVVISRRWAVPYLPTHTPLSGMAAACFPESKAPLVVLLHCLSLGHAHSA